MEVFKNGTKSKWKKLYVIPCTKTNENTLPDSGFLLLIYDKKSEAYMKEVFSFITFQNLHKCALSCTILSRIVSAVVGFLVY